MRAGRLDRRIVIERATESRDDYGSPKETWATHVSRKAQVTPLRGRSFFAAQQVSSEAEMMFRIRWHSDIKATDRIRYDGALYEIVHPPLEVGRRRGLDILARLSRDTD